MRPVQLANFNTMPSAFIEAELIRQVIKTAGPTLVRLRYWSHLFLNFQVHFQVTRQAMQGAMDRAPD